MMDLVTAVVPVFALVIVGYLAGRTGYVSAATGTGLAEFTFKLAVPALLFRTMATAELPDTPPGLIWLAYFGAVAIVWLAMTGAVPTLLRRPSDDAPSIAMSACFGNVVMIGIPLALAIVGDAAAGPVAVIISLHSPLIWACASAHFVLARQEGDRSVRGLLRDLVTDLAGNTIILAIIAGSLWRMTGLGLDPL
ncbi:MAG: AEC family transporter, partial [Pseudomonadota bacterium]